MHKQLAVLTFTKLVLEFSHYSAPKVGFEGWGGDGGGVCVSVCVCVWWGWGVGLLTR